MADVLDVEQALCDWLVDRLEAGPVALHRRVVTEVPADLFSPTALPCHVVERFGGPTRVVGLSEVNVDISTYATGTESLNARSNALRRAQDVWRLILLHLPGAVLGGAGGAVVTRRRVMTEPTIRPYDSRHQIRKAQAAYQITLHMSL